jgi:hypothetical protein
MRYTISRLIEPQSHIVYLAAMTPYSYPTLAVIPKKRYEKNMKTTTGKQHSNLASTFRHRRWCDLRRQVANKLHILGSLGKVRS